MIEKKIIPKDDIFITRRKRFNSLDEKEMALDIAKSLEELDPGRREARDYIRELEE